MTDMNTLIVATHNAHKLREIGQILPGWDIRGEDSGAEETAETFVGNARIKARAIAPRHPGSWVMADDSGLEVIALGGEPGVRSARYTGDHADSDEDRYRLVLKNLGDRTDRTARFVCALCCVFPNGDVLRSRGECEGEILFAPQGENGFGYDPVFKPAGFDCSMAELTMEEKNAISHRGRALAIFKQEWEKYTNAHK